MLYGAPPHTLQGTFCKKFLDLKNFKKGINKKDLSTRLARSPAGRRGRRSSLTPGFFHRHSAWNNRVSAVESHRKRYNISFSCLPRTNLLRRYCKIGCDFVALRRKSRSFTRVNSFAIFFLSLLRWILLRRSVLHDPLRHRQFLQNLMRKNFSE